MPANLENSAVATELEKVSFHSNPAGVQPQWTQRIRSGDGVSEEKLIYLEI